MPIPKDDKNSGAMVFYPTPQERAMIEERKDNRRMKEEIKTHLQSTLETKKDLEVLKSELEEELRYMRELRERDEKK